MPLPDIDFDEIRRHLGDQAKAFEELCCQLANDEQLPDRIRFDRKGPGGDGGVECFATHADGSETGWQVKYYSQIDSMLRSLGESIDTALVKHPAMTRFIACFPINLSDSRREGVSTALSKWNTWRKERIEDEEKKGRTIAIDRWDGHELTLRLTDSNPRSAGRIAFWFDAELLSREWFDKAFQRTTDSLGDRYSPESHIDIPVRRTILAALRDPQIFARLDVLARRIEARLVDVPAGPDGGACAAARLAAAELSRLAVAPPEPFPLGELIHALDAALDLAVAWSRSMPLTRSGDQRPRALSSVSNLVGALRAAGRNLRLDYWKHLDTRSLLVIGDAGTGKSHLLADACAHQVSEGRPALMVLGGKLSVAQPWGEILADLDLPVHLQVKQFLGALNAAGEAAQVRCLFTIDALNENNGQYIWPQHLAALLTDIRAFPWITAVLSCRSTYKTLVIPDTLDAAKLPRIEHLGFDDEDVVRYLRQRGISIPETPRQLDELRNPLFLRLTCDALKAEGEVLVPETLGGITDVLALFTKAVTRRVEANLGVSPRLALVSKAVAVLAGEMASSGRSMVAFDRADRLVRGIHDGSTADRDLLFQLENEGLLVVEQDVYASAAADLVMRFTFERIGDHFIAAELLQQSGTAQKPEALCTAGSPLHVALSDAGSYIIPGILEALAVQLPEQFGIELPDLDNLPDWPGPDEAFKASLLVRRASAFSDRTWALVEEIGDEQLRLDTLIALSSEPEHPHNVRALDAELRAIAMPARDATWSVHLTQSDRAMHLVDWAWTADQTRISAARAELAATQLAWFLTTTLRPLRDRATKALVSLLSDRAELAIGMWEKFKALDDSYVVERILAALYGAAMQGRWSEAGLARVAERIFSDIFADGRPPANALIRDHARGLIAYALVHGPAIPSIDSAKLVGPFESPWPFEHVTDATIAGYTRKYGESGTWQDEIVGSCNDGDFGRYVLDFAVQDWSPVAIGTSPLPTADELRDAWYEQFRASATPAMIEAHDRMLATFAEENPGGHAIYGETRDKIRAAKAEFLAVVGSDIFEEWREKAEHWRAEGMYQSHARRGPAELSLAWARRWVVKRAHDLGWSEALHGGFDRTVYGDRNDHRLERIGKKYQWLALFELVARLGDNLARLPDRDEDPLRLRDIDPSLLVQHTGDEDESDSKAQSFWTGSMPQLAATTPAEAIAWIHSSDDILDGEEIVAVRSPDDGRNWLVLTGFETWRVSNEGLHCEAWRRVACLVVREDERDAALAMLSCGHMTGPHDVPAASGAGFRIHLGEFPWSTAGGEDGDWQNGWRPFGIAGFKRGVAILPTTAEYLAEASGYDGSLDANVNFHLPARWLMEGLNMRLSDGRTIQYNDANGTTRFMDPSVSRDGRSAALVDRDAFLDLLARDQLVAIWTVAGEKNAYGENDHHGFGGRYTFTRLYYSQGRDLVAVDRWESFDQPSTRQRAAFLDESVEGKGDLEIEDEIGGSIEGGDYPDPRDDE